MNTTPPFRELILPGKPAEGIEGEAATAVIFQPYIDTILNEHPDLRGQHVSYPEQQGGCAKTLFIGNYVFKCASNPHQGSMLVLETQILRDLKRSTRTLGVGIPHITHDSAHHLYFGMTRLNGNHFHGDIANKLSPAEQAEYAKALARFVVDFHDITKERLIWENGNHTRRHTSSSPQQLYSMIQSNGIRQILQQHGLYEFAMDRVNTFASTVDKLDREGIAHHTDFGGHNILLDGEGGMLNILDYGASSYVGLDSAFTTPYYITPEFGTRVITEFNTITDKAVDPKAAELILFRHSIETLYSFIERPHPDEADTKDKAIKKHLDALKTLKDLHATDTRTHPRRQPRPKAE